MYSPLSIRKVQLSLVQIRREAPYIWDDFLLLLLLLLLLLFFTQTFSICHGNGFIYILSVVEYDVFTSSERYVSWIVCWLWIVCDGGIHDICVSVYACIYGGW